MRSLCRFEVGALVLLLGCELDTLPREAAPDAAVSGEPERRNLEHVWVPPAREEDAPLLAQRLRRPPARTTLRLLVTRAPSATGSEPLAPEFSVSDVRELHVHSVYSALQGQHRELRRYFAPNGDLYYQKLIAFSTELLRPAPFNERVALPHSTQILPVARDRALVSDSFPVAGTWISDRGLTGTWRLDVHVDNAREPSASLSFELVP